MASEMRVACVLCASHPCVRGEAPPPTPMCPFSSGISLASILLATSDRTCVSAHWGGRARNRMARSRAGARVSRGSCAA